MSILPWYLPFALAVLPSMVGFDSLTSLLAQGPLHPTIDNSTWPVLNSITPPCVQRGRTVELTLEGTSLNTEPQLHTSFPAKILDCQSSRRGKATEVRVRFTIPQDTPVGFQAVRCRTTDGLSNTKRLWLDDLPVVFGNTDNTSIPSAQTVSSACVVSGTLAPKTTAYFQFRVSKGQSISFEVLGERISSRIDPVIQLLQADGQPIPDGFANDSLGLGRDAALRYTFTQGGDYLIALSDATFRGGDHFHYLLRIGDFPVRMLPLPSHVFDEGCHTIRFVSDLVQPAILPVEIERRNDPCSTVQVMPHFSNKLPGGPIRILLQEIPTLLEVEPNGPSTGQEIALPVTITGQFAKPGDQDVFVFKAAKGTLLSIRVQSNRFAAPTEVLLRLQNTRGQELARSQPDLFPARLQSKIPADGTYRVVLEHLNFEHGSHEVYTVTLETSHQNYTLQVLQDRWRVPRGSLTLVPVIMPTRTSGLGPIHLSVVGPPGLRGSVIIPADRTARQDLPAAWLPVHAAPTLKTGPHRFRIVARTMRGQRHARCVQSQTLATQWGLNASELFAVVGPRVPIELEPAEETITLSPGGTFALGVAIKWDPAFAGKMKLQILGLPPGCKVESPQVLQKTPNVMIYFSSNERAKPGKYPLAICAIVNRQQCTQSLITDGIELMIRSP